MVLSIKDELADELSFDNIIHDFAEMKDRRKIF